MTNYITSVGVQQFSITIASGSTTGTATITAVGSGAFIIYGGVNPSVTTNSAEAYATLTLTNSTTITATRNTGTAGTVVVTGCIIDGDTTNLIKSVQFGTINVASSSATGTATISAVTNNNTAIHYLGHTSASAFYSNLAEDAILSLSGTTVTATRAAAPSAITVVFVAIEFQGTALNQAVQNVSASSTSASATTWTATITTVSTSNTICIYGGYSNLNNIGGNMAEAKLDGQLTNSTTFTVNMNTSSGTQVGAKTVRTTIIEFVNGVLNSAVQRGTTTLTAATSNTSTITAVTAANSGINYIGNTTTATSSGVMNQAEGAVALTNGTTVTTTKNTATNNITASWEVFEFPAFSAGGAVIGTGLHGIDGGYVADYGYVPSIDPGMHKIDDGITLELRMAA